MRRREFITILSGAMSTPMLGAPIVCAQQKPVVGLLHPGSAAAFKARVRGLHQGLGETGFVEGRNVVIDARWTDGNIDRLTPWPPTSSVATYLSS